MSHYLCSSASEVLRATIFFFFLRIRRPPRPPLFPYPTPSRSPRAAVRTTLSRSLPKDKLRAIIDEHQPLPADIWRQFAQLGWTGLLVPEEHGGLGLGLIDMCVVMEEMGKLPLPGPFYSSAVLATLAAKRLGLTDLLPALASGEARGTVAI